MKKSILALGLSLASVMLFAESLGEQNFKQKTSIPANIASSFMGKRRSEMLASRPPGRCEIHQTGCPHDSSEHACREKG